MILKNDYKIVNKKQFFFVNWINEANNDTENDQNIQVDKSDLNKITSDFDNKVCSTYGYSSLRNKRLNNT